MKKIGHHSSEPQKGKNWQWTRNLFERISKNNLETWVGVLDENGEACGFGSYLKYRVACSSPCAVTRSRAGREAHRARGTASRGLARQSALLEAPAFKVDHPLIQDGRCVVIC